MKDLKLKKIILKHNFTGLYQSLESIGIDSEYTKEVMAIFREIDLAMVMVALGAPKDLSKATDLLKVWNFKGNFDNQPQEVKDLLKEMLKGNE